MFRLDNNHIVDATNSGNVARFINHCCDPNSYAKVVRVRRENHIIIFSNISIMKLKTSITIIGGCLFIFLFIMLPIFLSREFIGL